MSDATRTMSDLVEAARRVDDSNPTQSSQGASRALVLAPNGLRIRPKFSAAPASYPYRWIIPSAAPSSLLNR